MVSYLINNHEINHNFTSRIQIRSTTLTKRKRERCNAYVLQKIDGCSRCKRHTDPWRRCVGTCLLPEVPESPRGICHQLVERGELGQGRGVVQRRQVSSPIGLRGKPPCLRVRRLSFLGRPRGAYPGFGARTIFPRGHRNGIQQTRERGQRPRLSGRVGVAPGGAKGGLLPRADSGGNVRKILPGRVGLR